MSSPTFESPGLYRTLLEDLPWGVAIVDREQRVLFWNRAAEQIVGHLSHEVVGRTCADRILDMCGIQGNSIDPRDSPLSLTLKDGQPRRFSVFLLHKQGHRTRVCLQTRPITPIGDIVVGSLLLFETGDGPGVSADTNPIWGCVDPFTGIPSHRLTVALLNECLAETQRSRRGFGVVRVRILGLDEFRSRHGIQSALPFLSTAAHTLRESLHAENFVGRWGEDEFIIVLPSANAVATKMAAETVWGLLTHSEVSWWGDRFPVQAVVMHTVAGPGEKLDHLLNGLEPSHAATAGRAIGLAKPASLRV